jgi:hypothetical protein
MESLLETLYIMSDRRGIHGSGHLQAAQEERAGEVSLIMRIDFTQQAQGVMTYHKLLYIYIYIYMYVCKYVHTTRTTSTSISICLSSPESLQKKNLVSSPSCRWVIVALPAFFSTHNT